MTTTARAAAIHFIRAGEVEYPGAGELKSQPLLAL
jgi:hypothetical protein